MIIDAKSLSTKITIYNMTKARGSAKTNTQTVMLLAYLESLRTGQPVDVDIGFKLVNIRDI